MCYLYSAVQSYGGEKGFVEPPVQVVYPGTQVTIGCVGDYITRWYKDGSIVPSQRGGNLGDSKELILISVTNVQPEHGGVYYCTGMAGDTYFRHYNSSAKLYVVGNLGVGGASVTLPGSGNYLQLRGHIQS